MGVWRVSLCVGVQELEQELARVREGEEERVRKLVTAAVAQVREEAAQVTRCVSGVHASAGRALAPL